MAIFSLRSVLLYVYITAYPSKTPYRQLYRHSNTTHNSLLPNVFVQTNRTSNLPQYLLLSNTQCRFDHLITLDNGTPMSASKTTALNKFKG